MISKLAPLDVIPTSTSLYAPFSFDVLSKHVPKVFENHSPGNVAKSQPVYMVRVHLTRCPEQKLSVSKTIAPETIPNRTGLYDCFSLDVLSKEYIFSLFFDFAPPKWSQTRPVCMTLSHLTCCPKKYLKNFKFRGARNDPKPYRCIWLFSHLTCCPKQYLKFFKTVRPRIYPKPDRFICKFSFDALSK